MIKDIISFSLKNDYIYAIDLQKTPIIVSAVEFIKNYVIFNDTKYYFQFDEVLVEVVDLHGYIESFPSDITEQTKILIGRLGKNVYGLLVDRVNEIITLPLATEIKISTKNFKNLDFINDELIIGKDKYIYINFEKLVENINLIKIG
jgi:hypothetical protein